MKMHYSQVWPEEDILDVNVAHSFVYSLCRKDQGRTLFRVENTPRGPYLLLQSPQRPTFEHVPGIKFQTKEIPVKLLPQKYDFKVRANTAKNVNRSRTAIANTQDRIKWITERFAQSGIKVLSINVESEPDGNLVRGDQTIPICAASFSGTIEVQDTEKAEQMLFSGIGKSKAFGYGMLLLRISHEN